LLPFRRNGRINDKDWRGNGPRTCRGGRIACVNRSTHEMKLVLSESPLRGHNKAAIGASTRRTRSVSSHDLQHSPSLLCPASSFLLSLVSLGLFPSDFAVLPLVPPLYLSSSLIKGSNYATSSRLSFPPPAFSWFRFPVAFPRRYFLPLFGSKWNGARCVHEALNAEYELSSKLNRAKPTWRYWWIPFESAAA